MTRSAPIGVFDSGMGGLTVMREIIEQLPNESVIYFGDTARVPYVRRVPTRCFATAARSPPTCAEKASRRS